VETARLGDEANAETRFALASLYLELGEESKGSGQFRELMTLEGDNPRYLTYYVQFLISRGEFGAAELWLSRLVKSAPLEFTTLTLTTELEFRRGRYDDILTLVEDYLAKFKEKTMEYQERTRLAAILLETYLERLKDASSENPETAFRQEWGARFSGHILALYRNNAKSQPNEMPALAAFLGRQGQHSESLDLLEKNWSDMRPDGLAVVTATLWQSPAATKEHFARAEQILNSALQKYDRPVVLVLALANLQNWGEEYSEAEESYREVLRKESRNAEALNNLALLLALRGRGGREPLALIETVLQIVGQDPGLLDTRSMIYLALGDATHAATDIAEAIRRQPFAASYMRQALVELRLGGKDAARASFAKATELGLKIKDLHPLERAAYRQLEADLR
jgi:Tfp pilus assembly protein PilF